MNTCLIQCSTEQRLFGISCLNWYWSDIRQPNTCVSHSTVVTQCDIRCHSGNRIIADFSLKLAIRAATAICWRKYANLRQDFIGVQRSLERRVGKEFFNGNEALTIWPGG